MLLAMFGDTKKICQMFSSEAQKLMFGVQKKYILFMCMVGIQISMPESLNDKSSSSTPPIFCNT